MPINSGESLRLTAGSNATRSVVFCGGREGEILNDPTLKYIQYVVRMTLSVDRQTLCFVR